MQNACQILSPNNNIHILRGMFLNQFKWSNYNQHELEIAFLATNLWYFLHVNYYMTTNKAIHDIFTSPSNLLQLIQIERDSKHNTVTQNHRTSERKVTSSTFLRGIWKKLNNNLSFTCVCKSGKQSLIFFKTSAFNWVQIEPVVHESFDVPSLLWSHKDVSLSRTFAIL